MVVFFARSGSRHPVLPAALGLLDRRQPLEPRRPDPAASRHRLHRPQVVARVQSGGQLHRRRRRDPARRARRARTASRGRRGARSTSQRGERPGGSGGRAARPLPRRRTSARARRPSAPSRPARSSTASRAPKSFRLEGGEEVEVQDAVAVPEPAAAARARDRRGRTSTCSSSTSRRGSSCTRRAATRAGRSCTRSPGRSRAAIPSGPVIVHRLDRDTSGLMALARSEEAHERLTELVRERAFERTYIALVHGRPRSRTRADRGADRPRPRRRDARLARHGLAARGDHELRGRARLARARAAARPARDGADAPDPRAPGGDRPAGRRRRRPTASPEPGLARQFLHAAALAFPHPFSGERIETTRGCRRPRRVPRRPGLTRAGCPGTSRSS